MTDGGSQAGPARAGRPWGRPARTQPAGRAGTGTTARAGAANAAAAGADHGRHREPAGPAGRTITLLSRPGCHLCDDARDVIARVASELDVAWEERDITTSQDDLLAYGEQIPVTLIDGVQHDFWRVDADRLRAALRG